MPEFLNPAIYSPDLGKYTPIGIPNEPPYILSDVLSKEPSGIATSYDGKRWVFSSRGFTKVQNEVMPGGVWQMPKAHAMNAEEISRFLGEINKNLEDMPEDDEKDVMFSQFNLACSRFEEMLALSDSV